MGKTSIEWTRGDDGTPGRVWNSLRGCNPASSGCKNCWAKRMASRFNGPGEPFEGLAERTPNGPRWTGEVRFVEEHLLDPLRWRKPARVFVNSVSDLFHEAVSDETIDKVFAVMALAPQHSFQVLTKRAERMAAYMSAPDRRYKIQAAASLASQSLRNAYCGPYGWPLPSVWLGVSVEDQAAADSRIPYLLQTPAAIRWLSCEPLLGPINLRECAAFDDFHIDALDTPDPSHRISWVICGGESGPGARPCNALWIQDLVRQCQAAEVPAFVKQLGAKPVWGPDSTPMRLKHKKGGDMTEWPEALRVREFPTPTEAK